MVGYDLALIFFITSCNFRAFGGQKAPDKSQAYTVMYIIWFNMWLSAISARLESIILINVVSYTSSRISNNYL